MGSRRAVRGARGTGNPRRTGRADDRAAGRDRTIGSKQAAFRRPMMDALVQDIRYGIRQLFRQGGSSVVAVLTLALGIGVSTAIFSVIDATMLRPLPYPDPEQLVEIYPEEVQHDGQLASPSPSMEDMRNW